jgi:hypothetical protein
MWGRVLRYDSETAEAVVVSDLDLFKTMVSSISGSTNSTTLPTALRLRGIRLSGSGDGTGSSIVILKWGDNRGPDRNYTLTFPATGERSSFYPVPENSLLNLWFDVAQTAGTTMFELDSTHLVGRLFVDVHVDYLFGTNLGVAGPTVGSNDDGVIYPNLPSGGTLTIVGFT